VQSLVGNFTIAAVNMSLGGGQNQTACDSDVRKGVIDQLRNAGIVTVIASGNDGFHNAVGAPGCISTAVTVGATTKMDTVANFSNSASLVDLLAPGQNINSSVPQGGFQPLNGTSMATPHVAGAFAVLRSGASNATVDAIENALVVTGQPITDNDNNLTRPRINVVAALRNLTPVVPTQRDWLVPVLSILLE
jgi:subtilisin family serine protease